MGVLITLASWGISRLYVAYSRPGNAKVVTVTSPTPTSQISTATSIPRPLTIQNRPAATATPKPIATAVPQTTKGGLAVQPNTGSETTEVQNPGINIYSPTSGTQASYPLKVTGSGNVTSKVVTLEVLDQNGYVLGTTDAAACYGTEACQFEASIYYTHPTTTTGYLYAYTINSLGQKAYEVLVPLSFN